MEVSATKVKELMSSTPSEGLVEIRLKDPKRSGTITVRGYSDESGNYRPLVDQNGKERVIKIQRTLNLNMKNVNDRLALAHIQEHPIYIKGSTPILVVVNHEVEANDFVEKKNKESQAMSIIEKLEGEPLRDFARVLLITVNPGSSDKVIKRYLYERATKDPELIINEWESDLRAFKVVIRKGIDKGVFTFRNGRYSFNEELMGTSFEAAVDYLKKNEDLIPSINLLLNK